MVNTVDDVRITPNGRLLEFREEAMRILLVKHSRIGAVFAHHEFQRNNRALLAPEVIASGFPAREYVLSANLRYEPDSLPHIDNIIAAFRTGTSHSFLEREIGICVLGNMNINPTAFGVLQVYMKHIVAPFERGAQRISRVRLRREHVILGFGVIHNALRLVERTFYQFNPVRGTDTGIASPGGIRNSHIAPDTIGAHPLRRRGALLQGVRGQSILGVLRTLFTKFFAILFYRTPRHRSRATAVERLYHGTAANDAAYRALQRKPDSPGGRVGSSGNGEYGMLCLLRRIALFYDIELRSIRCMLPGNIGPVGMPHFPTRGQFRHSYCHTEFSFGFGRGNDKVHLTRSRLVDLEKLVRIAIEIDHRRRRGVISRNHHIEIGCIQQPRMRNSLDIAAGVDVRLQIGRLFLYFSTIQNRSRTMAT